MDIDYELLKKTAEQYILETELYINDALSLSINEPLIVTTNRVKIFKKENIKCFFTFVSISQFDVDKYNIQNPYGYIKSIKNSRLYTYLGELYNNLFYTVMYVYVIDFNKHKKENDHE